MNVTAYTAGLASPGLASLGAAAGDAPAGALPRLAPSPEERVGSPSRSGDVNAGVQTAASYVQAASGYMGQVQDILSEMAAMAGSGEHSGAFSQLQGRLSSLVGAEGQGDAGRKSGATFDGIAIFGPQGGLEVDTGLSSAPALSVPATNLRQGAIQALTGRGAQGGFAIGAGSPQAASAVSAAIAEASAAAGAINRADGAVSAASAGTLADADPVPGLDAADASLGAAKAIASSWNLALAAQSQGPAQAAFGLLQSA